MIDSMKHLFLITLLLPFPLVAQVPDTLKQAKETLSSGKKFLEKGAFEDALSVFESGYQTYSDPEFLFFLGHTLLQLKRYQKAKETFEEYLEKQIPSKSRKIEITKLIKELSAISKTLLHIETQPAGATIWLDTKVEDPLGQSPFHGSILPGAHILIIELEGYQILKHSFTLEIEKETTLSLSLEKLPSMLVLDTEPSGATVFLNNTSIGTTPYQGEIAIGTHKINLQKEGFGTLSFSVNAVSGETISRLETLPPPPATLTITSDLLEGIVPDAQIFVDQEMIAPFPGTIELKPGTYLLSVDAKNYRPFSKKITASPGSNETIWVSLQKKGLSLQFKGNLPRAKIYLDGKFIGDIETAKQALIPEGTKGLIEVKQEGYLSFRKTFYAKSNEDSVLDVRLRKPGFSTKTQIFLIASGASTAFGATFGALAFFNDKKFSEVPEPELLKTIQTQAILADIGLGVAGLSAVISAILIQKEGGLKRSPGKIISTKKWSLIPRENGLSLQVSF